MICKELKLCHNNQQCKHKRKELCWEINNGSNVACSERNCRYSLHNPNRIKIRVFHVDGGLISDDEACLRCDYLYEFSTPSQLIVIFIELKGMDFGKALKQIESTVKIFADTFSSYERYARVICTRVPNIKNNPQDIKLQKSLRKLGINLKTGEKNITESISSLTAK